MRGQKLAAVVRDLADEASALDELLTSLAPDAWSTPTPAAGWDIRDSVAHVAVGDELALECVVEDRVPVVMQEGIDAVLDGQEAAEAFERKLVARGRARSAEDVHRWWRDGNATLVAALQAIDPDRRLPWGPNQLGTVSFTTARVMETWAHGLDCFDAVGVAPSDTDRLRHVAELSLRALPYAFMIHGLEMPGPVRLELASPSGESWSFGPEDAPTVIRGTASDWCRVAVHRDRRGERDRIAGEGPGASDVIKYAQAYL